MSAPPRLEARAVAVSYGGVEVLSGVSISVAPGEIVLVCGRNGAGKSTLLQALAGARAALRGAVLLDGRDLRSLSAKEISRRIAIVAQSNDRDLPFRVGEIVLLGRMAHARGFGFDSPRDRAAAEEAMRRTGVEAFAGRFPRELSEGEWQRARIARSLAQDADLLLLDEPTASLDPHRRVALAKLFDDLRADRKRAIVVVSHDIDLFLPIADGVVLMDRGRVLAHGSPVDIGGLASIAAALEARISP